MYYIYIIYKKNPKFPFSSLYLLSNLSIYLNMGQACCVQPGNQQKIYDNTNVTSTKGSTPYRPPNFANSSSSQQFQNLFKKVQQPSITSNYVRLKLYQLGDFKPKKYYQKGTLNSPRELGDGSIYVGQWKNQKPHGFGRLYSPNSCYYVGTFARGTASGEGRFIYPQCAYYEGEIKNNQACGYGVFKNETQGYEYIGQWLNDKPNGQGKEIWKNNSYYEGEILNGKKHGKGKYSHDNSSYEGQFNNNLFNSHGIYKWSDGRVYDGIWKQGKMNGYGVFTWPDGNRYEGEYINAKKQGKGKFYWKDGRIYDGQWKNGMKHGKGKLKLLNGKQIKGEWENGELKKQLS